MKWRHASMPLHNAGLFHRTVLLTALLVSAGFSQNPKPPASEQDAQFFETRVRPVLATKCYGCHADGQQLCGLRLDTREAIIQGGKRGPSVIPGTPDASIRIRARRSSCRAPCRLDTWRSNEWTT
jgi:hypothetical protein